MSNHQNQLNQAFKNYLCSADPSDSLRQDHLFGRGAVAELEQKIASFYGMKHALCVANATIGLMGLGLALEIKNSEFIASPYTFGGVASSWLLLNNSLIFADVEPQTATINPDAIKKVISPKTKAVLAVDILGNPSDSKALRKIADEFGVFYIADCAQSFGASRNSFPASHLADALVISFTTGKTLFAGEGGAIITNNSDLYEKLLWHTQHPFRQKRELGLGISNEFGINGRIHPLAAIWANQNFSEALTKLEVYQTQCLEVLKTLNESGLVEEVNFADENIVPSFFRLTVIPKSKVSPQEIINFLAQNNVECRVSGVPVSVIYQNPAFLVQFAKQFTKSICLEAERQEKKRISLVIENIGGVKK